VPWPDNQLIIHSFRARRALEVIMKSQRQPRQQVRIKNLSAKEQKPVKGGLNFTKITYNYN
jgi:hypothetical protein